MTKTEQLAKECADKKAMHEAEYYESYIAIKEAYEDGAQDMLERMLKYFEIEHPTFFEHFGDEFRKAMEE